MPITKDDLLIPVREQNAITAALANTGVTDPWTPAIAQGTQKVDQFTARYSLTEDHYKRLLRGLVLWEVYGLTGSIPESKQKLYDEVMQELKDIRDGKFDLPLNSTQPSSAAARGGTWGSEDKIEIRDNGES